MEPEIIRNTEKSSSCRIGWSQILSKYIKKLPVGYTKNYYFEIEDGIVRFKHLFTTADTDALSKVIFKDKGNSRARILRELFGHNELAKLSWSTLTLQKTEPLKLSEKKMISLARKYPTIPEEHKKYYPKPTKEALAAIEKADKENLERKNLHKSLRKRKKRKLEEKNLNVIENEPIKKRKVGRPRKNDIKKCPSQKDLTFFFKYKQE